MSSSIGKFRTLYVEKRAPFDVEACKVFSHIKNNLGISQLEGCRIILKYDVCGLSDEDFLKAKLCVFSEPPLDEVYDDGGEYVGSLSESENVRVFVVEPLEGQYNQRADFAEQCIKMLTAGSAEPVVKTAKVIVLLGQIPDYDFQRIKKDFINPIESCEASLDSVRELLSHQNVFIRDETVNGFFDRDVREIADEFNLAMDEEDFLLCREYFRSENRCPTVAELKVTDTYWSDHCRHTTFLTELSEVIIEDERINQVYGDYLKNRQSDKKVCLMDIALAAAKRLKMEGRLSDLDESEEINAASIKTKVTVKRKNGESFDEDYLVMFKNETHNHPTEIEPFGGASTCLGGAIRDPMSGRAYVYQSMRISGSADPRTSFEKTLAGKLPQRTITTLAADGFSSYGNQFGLATGLVRELYHPGYEAKRLELGAVIAATPSRNVRRERPVCGDVVILVGGKTGRDGCGGATGSSKAHNEESLSLCGAEVQKGNPPEERKIARLFRNPEASVLIKRCNDFGAGGVCVAVGELAAGLDINLSAVPKKYDGMNAAELAISESQERMAVVTSAEDAERFISLAEAENLEATPIAVVTDKQRLVMYFEGEKVVDISRGFLDSNGAKKIASAFIPKLCAEFNRHRFSEENGGGLAEELTKRLSSLDLCSQKGLIHQFDNSIGGGTVLSPLGGKNLNTPSGAMAALIPVEGGVTDCCSIMSYGFDVSLAQISPFHSAVFALVTAAARIVCAGGDYRKAYFSLQEYFEKLGSSSESWGKPLSALLGAYCVQIGLSIPAIGGKDSMSGSFGSLNVPPTLVAFGVCMSEAPQVVSNELKSAGHNLLLLECSLDSDGVPDFDKLRSNFDFALELMRQGKVYSASAIEHGLFELAVCCFGNNVGIEFFDGRDIFSAAHGSVVLEVDAAFQPQRGEFIGRTVETREISYKGESMLLDAAFEEWDKPLKSVFPYSIGETDILLPTFDKPANLSYRLKRHSAPKAFIPVFPGTNCEYDCKRAFEVAGAEVDIFVINNRSNEAIKASLEEMAKRIANAQILMLAGGFSAGDEPDGSAKFIVSCFKHPILQEAVSELLGKRDGLVLGVCNGFQALIKLGLLPHGEIKDFQDKNSPTLSYNTSGKHVCTLVKTRVVSCLSPWFYNYSVGEEIVLPISHGEGRFVCTHDTFDSLLANGQVAAQYCGFNPNGSFMAVEALCSPDGRVLGKMGHNERAVIQNTFKNTDISVQNSLFEAGVQYFM